MVVLCLHLWSWCICKQRISWGTSCTFFKIFYLLHWCSNFLQVILILLGCLHFKVVSFYFIFFGNYCENCIPKQCWFSIPQGHKSQNLRSYSAHGLCCHSIFWNLKWLLIDDNLDVFSSNLSDIIKGVLGWVPWFPSGGTLDVYIV